MISIVTAYIDALPFAVVTAYQLWWLYQHRHVRRRYAPWRVILLWLAIAATSYFTAAYLTPLPILPGRVTASAAILALAWHIHRVEDEREEKAQQREQIEAEREYFDRMREEIVTNVAHELRTPLTVILGYSRMLKNKEIPSDFTEEAIEAIWNNARRLFLGENRILAGAQRFDPVRTDLVALIHDIIIDEDVWLVTRKRRGQVDILFDNAQEPIVAYIDENKIRTAVFQLIHNAVKFGKVGGFVAIILNQTETEVTITVTDDGKGIDLEKHDRYLWQMLSQINGSSIRAAEGMGQGLWVAKKLVELHDGSITVESTPGVGSTFVITLPQ